MNQDLLAVFCEPGEVPPDEFHDWYDNEHVPLRMQFPEFHNGYRFRAVDDLTPAWLATYDVEPGFLATSAYTSLRSHRSAREQHLVQRLGVLDRHIYTLDYEAGSLTGRPRYRVLVGLTSTDERGLLDWYRNEHIPLLLSIPGWNRIRQFRRAEGNGQNILTIHDIENPDLVATEQWKEATSTNWRTRIMATVTDSSRRVFRFHNSGR